MAYSTSSTTPYTHSAARYTPPMEFDMSTLTLFDTSFLDSAKDSACSTYPPAQCPDQILARFELGLFFHDASKRRKMSSSELSHLQKLWNAVSDDGSRVPPTNGWKGKPRSSDSDATVRALPVRAPGVGARPRFRFENRQPDQRLELVYSSAPCRRGTSIPPRHRLANLQASQAAENQGHRTHAVDETVPLSFVVETDDIHAIVDAVKLAEENNIQRGGLAIRRAVIAAAEQRWRRDCAWMEQPKQGGRGAHWYARLVVALVRINVLCAPDIRHILSLLVQAEPSADQLIALLVILDNSEEDVFQGAWGRRMIGVLRMLTRKGSVLRLDDGAVNALSDIVERLGASR